MGLLQLLFFRIGWWLEQIREWLDLSPFPIHPPSDVFYVSGRHLYDNGGRKVVLRGINLPLLDDWSFPGQDKLDHLERTGANAVRIQWYVNYLTPTRPAYTVAHLDAILEKCRTRRLIPIVMLGDFTVGRDMARLNDTLVPWWVSPAVVAVLKRHERYVIINLANELGVYRWVGSTPAALNAYRDAYKTAITSIRAAGLRMPIMIDAPDGGTSIDVFNAIGAELIAHDPRRSILLSVHAYWAGYNGRPGLDEAVDAGLPIVFGEIANKQDEDVDGETSFCHYDLDGTQASPNPTSTGFRYQSLLIYLTQLEVGWLAWSWWKDGCTVRQMTLDGNYAGGHTGLTAYGYDLLHHATYGMRTGYFATQRSPSLPGAPPPP